MNYPVSIIILGHNAADLTALCLKSILKSESFPKELIFVNNGSTDSTSSVIDSIKPQFKDANIDFKLITNDDNLGCSLARNMAWKEATQPYVVFMDNDTHVCTKNWLKHFTKEMDADPKLGILGAKMIYPFKPHTIQCAGVDISKFGRIRFRGRGQNRNAHEFNQFIKVPVLISACWIKRREFLEELGGLDEHFHPVQYEDFDLCMKVNQAGYYCAYSPEVEIYHYEGKTTASFGKENYQRNIVEQSLKFRQRWSKEIKDFPEHKEIDFTWLADDALGLTAELNLEMI